MSDEQSKKSLSEPPPPTDEIDQEWGTTPGAAAHASSGSAPESRSDVEDEDEDDEDEDEDEEDEDDEDEEEEEEDEDDEDERAHTARPVHASEGRTSSNDWLPDWSPWAVLAALLAIGIAGGLGFFGGSSASDVAPTESAEPSSR